MLERVAPPTFPLVIEMRERAYWVTHWVEDSVDCLLHGKVPIVQARPPHPPGHLPPALSLGRAHILQALQGATCISCANQDANEVRCALLLCHLQHLLSVIAVPSAASPVCASMGCNVHSA